MRTVQHARNLFRVMSALRRISHYQGARALHSIMLSNSHVVCHLTQKGKPRYRGREGRAECVAGRRESRWLIRSI